MKVENLRIAKIKEKELIQLDNAIEKVRKEVHNLDYLLSDDIGVEEYLKRSKQLSLQEYESLLDRGILWEVYPGATGSIDTDLDAVCQIEEQNYKKEIRFGIIHKVPTQKRFFYDIIDEEVTDYDW